MNAGNQPLVSIQQDCNSVVAQVTAALKSTGYFVTQSFDLHSAMTDNGGCNCDQDSCTCQMVVLLVYAQDESPVTLIFDSNQSQTIVYLVNSPSHFEHPSWIAKVTQLFPNSLSTVNPVTPCVE